MLHVTNLFYTSPYRPCRKRLTGYLISMSFFFIKFCKNSLFMSIFLAWFLLKTLKHYQTLCQQVSMNYSTVENTLRPLLFLFLGIFSATSMIRLVFVLASTAKNQRRKTKREIDYENLL